MVILLQIGFSESLFFIFMISDLVNMAMPLRYHYSCLWVHQVILKNTRNTPNHDGKYNLENLRISKIGKWKRRVPGNP